MKSGVMINKRKKCHAWEIKSVVGATSGQNNKFFVYQTLHKLIAMISKPLYQQNAHENVISLKKATNMVTSYQLVSNWSISDRSPTISRRKSTQWAEYNTDATVTTFVRNCGWQFSALLFHLYMYLLHCILFHYTRNITVGKIFYIRLV